MALRISMSRRSLILINSLRSWPVNCWIIRAVRRQILESRSIVPINSLRTLICFRNTIIKISYPQPTKGKSYPLLSLPTPLQKITTPLSLNIAILQILLPLRWIKRQLRPLPKKWESDIPTWRKTKTPCSNSSKPHSPNPKPLIMSQPKVAPSKSHLIKSITTACMSVIMKLLPPPYQPPNPSNHLHKVLIQDPMLANKRHHPARRFPHHKNQ